MHVHNDGMDDVYAYDSCHNAAGAADYTNDRVDCYGYVDSDAYPNNRVDCYGYPSHSYDGHAAHTRRWKIQLIEIQQIDLLRFFLSFTIPQCEISVHES